jgi:hypothetical protein
MAVFSEAWCGALDEPTIRKVGSVGDILLRAKSRLREDSGGGVLCPFAWCDLPEELVGLVVIGEDDVYQLCHLEEAFTAGIGEEVCARAGA